MSRPRPRGEYCPKGGNLWWKLWDGDGSGRICDSESISAGEEGYAGTGEELGYVGAGVAYCDSRSDKLGKVTEKDDSELP